MMLSLEDASFHANDLNAAASLRKTLLLTQSLQESGLSSHVLVHIASRRSWTSLPHFGSVYPRRDHVRELDNARKTCELVPLGGTADTGYLSAAIGARERSFSTYECLRASTLGGINFRSTRLGKSAVLVWTTLDLVAGELL